MNVVPSPRAVVALIIAVVVAAESCAQASPGFRLFGPLNGTSTHLVDVNGTIVHTWPSTFLPGVGVYMLPDGTLLRAIRTPGAPNVGGTGGGVQRLALDGTVLWDFRYDGPNHWSHHDIEPMPNGNVLMLAWDLMTAADAIAAGRNPALIGGTVYRPDSVIEVQPTGPTTGTIVWEWHMRDHLVQDFDPTKANWGVVAQHPELLDINYPPDVGQEADLNHMNSVKYDPVFDRIMVSSFAQSEIYVIDHSTTTAEAAGNTGGMWGRGGDILYRYGNPEAYDLGTPADRAFFYQHSARFIPPGYPGAGNFTAFSNGLAGGNGSTIWEYTPPMDAFGNFVRAPGAAFGPAAPAWTYSAPGFFSQFVSSAERLANGNTLICSGFQNGWIFEVNPAGQILSTYTHGTNVFHAHYVDRRLWASKPAISAGAGESVNFDVIAGSQFAGKSYILLGSGSGTTPGIQFGSKNLPLNPDDVLLFTYANANTPLLLNTFGVLDALGRGIATLDLPPFFLPGSVQAYFACAIVDLSASSLEGTTNPVTLTITP